MTDIEQLLQARLASLQVEQAHLQAALARLREMEEEARLLRQALQSASGAAREKELAATDGRR